MTAGSIWGNGPHGLSSAKVSLDGVAKVKPVAARVFLAGELGVRNSFGNPEAVVPKTDSFTVIRMKTQ